MKKFALFFIGSLMLLGSFLVSCQKKDKAPCGMPRCHPCHPCHPEHRDYPNCKPPPPPPSEPSGPCKRY